MNNLYVKIVDLMYLNLDILVEIIVLNSLHSKHVDKNPGDREEECHGDLEPVGLEIGKKDML